MMVRLMRGRERGQIALEFIIVYSVVLIVFILVFAVISGQRSAILNTQQASIARIEAQEIASYIDQAVSAGSGYYTTLALAQGSGAVPYNIYISTSGVVIVNSTGAGQPVSAFAFSSGQNMSINGSLQYPPTYSGAVSIFLIPAYTGTIRIANIGGTVYIDGGTGVSNAGLLGGSVATDIQEGYAPNFNLSGRNSIVYIADDNALWLSSNPPNYTVLAWVRRSSPTRPVEILSKGNSVVGGYELAIGTSTCSATQVVITKLGGSALCAGTIPQDTAWHEVGEVYNSTGSYAYVDGGLSGASVTSSTGQITASANAPLEIGVGVANKYFTGQITDVQIYNGSLSANQMAASYYGGPFAGPVNQRRVVGWWPLDGNGNDYSGNGQNGQYDNITFQTLARPVYSVLARNGTTLSNVPIGVVISNGIAGGLLGATHGLSVNGAFSPMLLYNTVNPNVTSFSFDGNLSTANSLIGWLPLTFGDLSRNTLYDISGGNDNITVAPGVVTWQPQTFYDNFAAASFSSNSPGAITVNAIGSLLNITGSLTVVSWIKLSGANVPGQCDGILGSGGTSGSGIQLMAKTSGGSCGVLYIDGNNIGGNYIPPLSGNWMMVSAAWNGGAGTAYVFENGNLVYSGSGLGSSIAPSGGLYYIGAASSNGVNTFNGLISNVQLYSQALSSTQIGRLYSAGPTGLPLVGSGLSGWWPMAGSLTDYSGGNNGTIVNNALFSAANYTFNYTTGPASRLATFNGVIGGIRVRTGGAIPFNSPFSASFWFTSANGVGQTFNSVLVDANPFVVAFSGSPAGAKLTLSEGVNLQPGYAATTNLIYTGIAPRNLYNIVVAASATTYTAYLNGVQISSGPSVPMGDSGVPEFASSGNSLYIGGSARLGLGFNGQIADLQVYNSVLTSAQARQIYQQGVTPQSLAVLSGG
jgi:uncharacterized protein (UPF0333 family)